MKTIDHGRDLLALVRVDQKHDFIVSHCVSLWLQPPVYTVEQRMVEVQICLFGTTADCEREFYVI